jgi:serine/threonine-protein kinase
VAFVAEGTFSRVFRARSADGDVASPPAYAVKRLKPELEDDATAVQFLRREARVGSTVHHPRLAPILAAHVERPPYYLVLPWLAGSTLEAIIERAVDEESSEGTLGRTRALVSAKNQPPVSLIHALWFARQIAEALAALDEAGWTHSDVKPANVMISPQGHATLIDLGLARRPADEDHSIDRAQVGTPLYMAPELFVSSVRPDIRSDVFSLGMVLLELLTGHGSNRWDHLGRSAAPSRRPAPLDTRELSRAAPPSVVQLVQQMLAGEPLRRPQKPAELVSALTAIEIEFFADGME